MKIHKEILYKNTEPPVAYLPETSKYIDHAFTYGKQWKNMSFTFGKYWEVYRRKQEFLKINNFGLLKNTVHMDLEHKDRIFTLNKKSYAKLEHHRYGAKVKCDCLLSTESGFTISITTADCIDTIISAKKPDGKFIKGIIHTGWRGVNIGLAKKVIKHLTEKYKVKLKDIHLGILPSILKYNNRMEFLGEDFDKKKWGDFISEEDGVFYIDQMGFVLHQFLNAGVPSENIELYDIDTYDAHARGETFSHKYYLEHDKAKGVPEGRFMLAIRS